MKQFAPKLLNFAINMTDTPNKRLIVLAASVASIVITKRLLNFNTGNTNIVEQSGVKKKRIAVDKTFFKKIFKLLRIVFPTMAGKEILTLSLLTFALFMRTVLSIYMSEITSSIVKTIVNRDFTAFVGRILQLVLLAFPGSFINSCLDYLNKRLALYFRENLTVYLQKNFLKDMCYYKITNLDSRIRNPDQVFTADIEKFCYTLSGLYNNFSKPLLDIILFSRKLSQNMGARGPAMMIGWYLASGVLMRYISPNFPRLTATEQNLEGQFRACHKALIDHSEEIAFYRGNQWELIRLNSCF